MVVALYIYVVTIWPLAITHHFYLNHTIIYFNARYLLEAKLLPVEESNKRTGKVITSVPEPEHCSYAHGCDVYDYIHIHCLNTY